MRTPIVIKYKQPKSLVDRTIPYHGTVITANQKMAEAMNRSGVNVKVREANRVLRVLLTEWYGKNRRLEQFILLDEIVNNMCVGIKGKEQENVFRAMKNNKVDLLASISALVEIGAEPDMLPANNPERSAFKKIYNDFIADERSGVASLEKKLRNWENADGFRFELETNIEESSKRPLGVPRAVYFQGFYYITPLQSRLINAYRSLGIPVYFLNNDDDKQSPYYEIWEKNPRFQEKMMVRKADEAFSRSEEKPQTRSIVKYKNAFAMVRELDKVKASDTAIYAVMSTQVKDILETFFPKTEEKMHMLAYPVGQYLFSLYKMWDEEEGLILDRDNVRVCLATGWAGSHYEDSKVLLSTYDTVQDYFRACRTLEDWNTTLDRLYEVKQKVIPLFENAEGKNLRRWREVITNPFHNLGAFSISEEQLSELTEAIRHMSEDARMLFAGGETLNLKEHFRKVYKLLKDKAPKEMIDKEEAAVLDIILERMQWTPNIKECRPTGLAEAMSFYLGGELDEKYLTDTEDEAFGPARGLSDIESAHIMHTGKKIMVCGCDSKSMPGSNHRYPWPLTRGYIESLTGKAEVEKRCQDYLHCMENALLGNRYLFHLANQLENVEFSWIVLVNREKELNPSVYLMQLKEKYGIEIDEKKNSLKENSQDELCDAEDCKLAKQAMAVLKSEEEIWPDEIEMDVNLCPKEDWRLFYDYILASHPVFTDSYHLQFYFSQLIAIMKNMNVCDAEEAANHIFEAYPSYTESERQELLDFAKRLKKIKYAQDRKQLAGNEYTLARHYLQYLDVDNVNNCIEGKKPGKKAVAGMCKYCPHGAYCFVRGS